jgi:phage terminase small subunit
MPARKPRSLIVRHETAAEQAERAARELSARPERSLPSSPPAQLKDRLIARAAWRYLMRRFGETEGEIVTGFDLHLVINFCMALEQLAQLNMMRDKAYEVWLGLAIEHKRLSGIGKVDDVIFMAIKVVDAFDAVVKLDSRIDRKADLIHKLSQSLYLTPRSRAGVAPTKKEPESPPDELEQLMDEFVGAAKKGDVR